MTEKIIVSIEGNIGAGKTTFLSRLIELYPQDIEIIYEPVNIWVAYNVTGMDEEVSLLSKFYEDPKQYAFPFQVAVMTSQMQTLIKQIGESMKKIIVVDRSLFSSYHVFCQALYHDGKLTIIELEILTQLMKMFEDHLLLYGYEFYYHIYLYTDPEVCLERIRKRARAEEVNISLDYLKQLHEHHQLWLMCSAACGKSLTVNANMDMEQQQGYYDTFIANMMEHLKDC